MFTATVLLFKKSDTSLKFYLMKSVWISQMIYLKFSNMKYFSPDIIDE